MYLSAKLNKNESFNKSKYFIEHLLISVNRYFVPLYFFLTKYLAFFMLANATIICNYLSLNPKQNNKFIFGGTERPLRRHIITRENNHIYWTQCNQRYIYSYKMTVRGHFRYPI